MMSPSWKDIRSLLADLPHDKLLATVQDLYKFRKENRDFLHTRFLKGIMGLDEYKATIQKYMYPKEPWKPGHDVSLSKAKKAISDYRKAVKDPYGLIELMIFYVECGTGFSLEFGDMDEPFYSSLESVFAQVLTLLKPYPLEEIDCYVVKLKDIVYQTRHMGWGYHDALSDMLSEYLRGIKV